jgi:hypothetical protein
MNNVAKTGIGADSDARYFISIRSKEQDAFLDGKLTPGEYLEHLQKVTNRDVLASGSIADEDKRLVKASRRLSLLSRVTFFFLAPLAYLVIGVVAIFNHVGSAVGWLSLITAAAVVSLSLPVSRWLRRSDVSISSRYLPHNGPGDAQ